MSVFTPVTESQARLWLKNYTIGQLTGLQGIAAGIENTNYFLTTTHGEYVLTLFEKLSFDELPYYLHLMAHLAHHGIPCPLPMEKRDGEYLSLLNGKPACIVTRLAGRPLEAPSPAHCAQVGEMLANMHLAGTNYQRTMENWRGLKWWQEFVPKVAPLLPDDEACLIASELAFQVAQDYACLPHGVIHGDFFRDNVLFVDGRIGGVIDFYFACNEALLFDLAIAVNDWCAGQDARLESRLADSLIAAYHDIRSLSDAERDKWPAMLRAAAFRSWLGRLGYSYFPQPGELTHTKNDGHFRRLLEYHRNNAVTLKI
ncbi:MAG: homoserine kinase [Burkholderiales bacterium]|nr:homoserine kinase [Burkholderiales bacterium]